MSDDDVLDEGKPNTMKQNQSNNLKTKKESSEIIKIEQKAPIASVQIKIDHTKILDLRNYDGSWSYSPEWELLFRMNDLVLEGLNTVLKSDYEKDILATLISLAFIQA